MLGSKGGTQQLDGLWKCGAVYLSADEKAVCMLRMRPSFIAVICARMLLACRSNNSSLASCAACTYSDMRMFLWSSAAR